MNTIKAERNQPDVVIREALKEWLYAKPANDEVRKEYIRLQDGTYVFTAKAELLISALSRSLTHDQIQKIADDSINAKYNLNSFRGRN